MLMIEEFQEDNIENMFVCLFMNGPAVIYKVIANIGKVAGILVRLAFNF